jgi:hypothetical protein
MSTAISSAWSRVKRWDRWLRRSRRQSALSIRPQNIAADLRRSTRIRNLAANFAKEHESNQKVIVFFVSISGWFSGCACFWLQIF